MKRIILGLSVFSMTLLYGQDEEDQNRITSEYNKWSIEVQGGAHKPSKAFAPGYSTDTPAFWQAGLGVRYMFNDHFGLKADFGYQNITNSDDSSEFETNLIRAGLEGVVNAGNVLKFRNWTNSLNFLVHGGLGYGANKPTDPVEFDSSDNMLYVQFGVTPQLKLSNRVVLFGDLSNFMFVRQSSTWDGTMQHSDAVGNNDTRGFNAHMVNASVGLMFYLGSEERHADWFSEEEDLKATFMELDKRVSKVENDMIDSDNDGVPDYLDLEPNTPSGITTDHRGRTIDKNENGIPDDMEPALDRRYVMRSDEPTEAVGGLGVKELLNDGYVNVYFRFNSDAPETYSLDAIKYLVQFMKSNPEARAELVGYTDEIGDAEYNMQLSERRAEAVYDIMVASGVEADRLSHRGGGVDDTVDKDSSAARQLVRRVQFELQD